MASRRSAPWPTIMSRRTRRWRSTKHRQQWRTTLNQYCQPIWSKPVDQIATADVLACLKPVWSRTPESGLVSGAGSKRSSTRRGRSAMSRKTRPTRRDGKATSTSFFPSRNKLAQDNHHKALPYANVAEVVKRLRASDSMTSLALEFVILTATRTSETLGARWQEFDLEVATWSIPAARMKAGRDHSVPLSNRAVEIVREARRRARKEPEPDSFVFFGTRPKKPVSPMAMPMLLRRMKVDATVHGFRDRRRGRGWPTRASHSNWPRPVWRIRLATQWCRPTSEVS